MKAAFKVRPLPNASDYEKMAHFTITGPDVNKFSEMVRIAKLLEVVLNAADKFSRE